MNFFLSLTMMISLNILVALIPAPKLNEKSGKIRKFITDFIEKLKESFKYSTYIRLFIETFQFLLLSNLSIILHFDISSTPKVLSLIFSIVISLLCLLLVYISFYMYQVSYDTNYSPVRLKWEEFLTGLKPDNTPRLYSFLTLIRRLFMIIWLLSFNFLGAQVLTIGLLVIQIPYVIYILKIRPFVQMENNIIEGINEIFLCSLITFLCFFYEESRWNKVAIGVFMFMVMLNTIIICIIMIGKGNWLYRYRRLCYLY